MSGGIARLSAGRTRTIRQSAAQYHASANKKSASAAPLASGKRLTLWLTLALVAALAFALSAGPAAAGPVVLGPTSIPGGVDPILDSTRTIRCSSLNAANDLYPTITSDFGFKIDANPTGGTYTLIADDGTLNPDLTTMTGGAPEDPGNSVTITPTAFETGSGLATIFSWTASLGIDAVIVKAQNSYVYVYDPESIGPDGNLQTPDLKAISHIEFCYDYEVDVSKTATTSFTRTFDWTIDKSVTPETWDLFAGDSGTSKYTVEVEKDSGTDSDWAVSGTITIVNNTPFDATIESVDDVVSVGLAANVDCGVMFQYTLPARNTLDCTYSGSLPNGSERVNTATVTTTGDVGGGEATADVVFGDPTTKVNDRINVSDTNDDDGWQFDDTGMVMYERDFSCGVGRTHNNTATIDETRQSAMAAVTVNCWGLSVSKDAQTSLTRTWSWTIVKTASASTLTLAPGQVSPDVTYMVEVNASSVDSGWAVSGEIMVSNLNPSRAATLVVSDLVSPSTTAVVDCGGATSVPAGGLLTCSYSADLADAAARTNTATATLQNNSFNSSGVATPTGTTTGFDSAAVHVVFNSDTTVTEVDESIVVSDTYLPSPLGTVFASDMLPKTFEYTRAFGPFADPAECGEHTFVNTASFVTNDTGALGSSSWTVTVDVACVVAGACTLTPGYWKTHSKYGPAPYDDTWELVGEDTGFFTSGASYYDVLWTPPQGNAYYILARAYIASELNELNGADFSAAQSAYDGATGLFEAYTPADVAKMKGRNGRAERAQFIAYAQTLDEYNNGLIGPGHCSE